MVNVRMERAMKRVVALLSILVLIAGCGGADDPPPDSAVPDATPQAQATPPAPPPGAGATAFTGAGIWDGTGSAVQYGVALIVRDGRVEGITDAIPEGAQVVDLTGQFITPGFINTHGHVSGRWAAEDVRDSAGRIRGDLSLYARYGITSVLSLGGIPDEGIAIRDAQNDPSLRHARLHLAGAVVAGDTPEQASAIALANIEKGVDWIKIRMTTISARRRRCRGAPCRWQ